MTTSPETSTTTEPTLAEERDRLWNEAVTTLTAAVRLNHPTDGPLDFADFLASALAAVAGNVGSIERLTAGRPGSWEAADLNRLLFDTLGDDPDTLLSARTEPVIVQLNVAQLAGDASAPATQKERAARPLDFFTALDALPGWPDDREPTEEEEQAWDAAEVDLRRRYAEAYEAYAQRFTAAILEAAARDMPALTVPVEVQTVTDPESDWWTPGAMTNPDDLWDGTDELAAKLWATARAKVGLPTLDEPSGE